MELGNTLNLATSDFLYYLLEQLVSIVLSTGLRQTVNFISVIFTASLQGGYCLQSLAEGAALTLRALLGDPCPVLPSQGRPCEG